MFNFAHTWTAQASQLPTPAHGTVEWTASCGTRLTLRPVRTSDAALLGDLFERGLSRAARYSRFHGAVGRLSDARLTWMATADFDRHAAFIVTCQQDGLEHAVGEGRWVRTAAAPGAEFALAVADAWQRQGIGGRLLAALVQAGRDQGLTCLTGDVMPGNRAMQALAGGQHFDCAEHPAEAGLVQAQLSLAPPVRAGFFSGSWLH